jgi:selenoprotein W-related protein
VSNSKVSADAASADAASADAASVDPGPAEAGARSGASERSRITIEYCPRCGWLLRSAWLAQELLTTFHAEIGELALIPSLQSGTFRVQVNDRVVWSRQTDGGFPAAAELKRRVRDHVAPGRALGHLDALGPLDAGGSEGGAER